MEKTYRNNLFALQKRFRWCNSRRDSTLQIYPCEESRLRFSYSDSSAQIALSDITFAEVIFAKVTPPAGRKKKRWKFSVGRNRREISPGEICRKTEGARGDTRARGDADGEEGGDALGYTS